MRAQLELGSNFVRPAALELEAAAKFLATVPTAEMVKFAKNGSDVTTAAVRLARAATGRPLVALCSSQPFFSTDDWFIGTTGMPAGIPASTTDLTVGFPYGDIDAVSDAGRRWPGGVRDPGGGDAGRPAGRATCSGCASCAPGTAWC